MRVGSAEVGGLIEVVEFSPDCDLAWNSVTGIDQRGRWRLRAGPRRAARASSCGCSSASPAAASGRWLSEQLGGPDRARQRQADAGAAQAGGRARAAARRRRAAEGGTGMRKRLLVAERRCCAAGAAPPRPSSRRRATSSPSATTGTGTADLVDPRRFKVLKRLNIVPDRAERMAEIQSDPAALALLPRHPPADRRGPRPARRRRLHLPRRAAAVRVAPELRGRRRDPPEHRRDRLAHARSRATAPTTWRSRPTATRLLVSASTARKVHVIDTRTGRIVGSFESGDQPHENNFSADGKLDLPRVSIGSVFTPADDPLLDATRATAGSRSSTRRTLQVLQAAQHGRRSSPRPATRT